MLQLTVFLLILRRVLIDYLVPDFFIFPLLAVIMVAGMFLKAHRLTLRDIGILCICTVLTVLNSMFINFLILYILAFILKDYPYQKICRCIVMGIVFFLIFHVIIFVLGFRENEVIFLLNKTEKAVNSLGFRSANSIAFYFCLCLQACFILRSNASRKAQIFLCLLFLITYLVVFYFCQSRGGFVFIFIALLSNFVPTKIREIMLKKLNFILFGLGALSLWLAWEGYKINELNMLLTTRPACWHFFVQGMVGKDFIIGSSAFGRAADFEYCLDSSFVTLFVRNGIVGYIWLAILIRSMLRENLRFLVKIFPIVIAVIAIAFFESFFYGVGITTVLMFLLMFPVARQEREQLRPAEE